MHEAVAVNVPNPASPKTRTKRHLAARPARRFAACGIRFAAVARGGRDGVRERKKAGFFRVCFAGRPGCASFEAWKSSFAKLAAIRVELSSGGSSGRRERAPSWSSSSPTAFTNTSRRRSSGFCSSVVRIPITCRPPTAATGSKSAPTNRAWSISRSQTERSSRRAPRACSPTRRAAPEAGRSRPF